MATTAESLGVSTMLRISLENWAKNSAGYSLLFKTLSKDVLNIANDAFNEMHKIAPGVYDFWWAKNHVRYINHCKQRELLLLHEIMYKFLTAFARGELNEPVTSQGRKAKVKA